MMKTRSEFEEMLSALGVTGRRWRNRIKDVNLLNAIASIEEADCEVRAVINKEDSSVHISFNESQRLRDCSDCWFTLIVIVSLDDEISTESFYFDCDSTVAGFGNKISLNQIVSDYDRDVDLHLSDGWKIVSEICPPLKRFVEDQLVSDHYEEISSEDIQKAKYFAKSGWFKGPKGFVICSELPRADDLKFTFDVLTEMFKFDVLVNDDHLVLPFVERDGKTLVKKLSAKTAQ